MSIHVLSELVAAQIAAGEVVERPASVVKELVENALDAAATDIHVEIEDGGRQLIRISDNGLGIIAGEVELAFQRHATSKLETINDLNHINTLGFRGEALHSIAAVSRLSLTTRHRDEDAGAQVLVEGGAIRDRRVVGVPAGTVITVEDLFFNTPARLKFLKSTTTERRHITTMVTNYAMAYPDVRFTLHHDGREVLRTYGSGQLIDVLVKTLGTDIARAMLEVTPQPPSRPDLPEIIVHGYTSTPDQTRSNRSHITLFVNGRSIQDSSLTYAVTQAYHTLIPKGRYPVAVLMIDMSPEEVDVNVHPTKAEVRFRSPDAVFSAVQRAVRSAVVAQSPAPMVRRDSLQSQAEPDHGLAPGWQERRDRLTHPERPARQQQSFNLDLDGPGEFTQRQPPPGTAETQPPPEDDFAHIPDGPTRPAQPRTLPMLRVLGQVAASYIVAEGPAGLYLIDQHAAHERILFEQLLAEQATHDVVSQQTLDAVTVDLPIAAVNLIEENMDILTQMGFQIEPFGGSTIRIRAVPAILAHGDPIQAIQTILEDLEIGAQPGQKTLEEQIALHVCKAAAVKAGQILSTTEMQSLIRQLERSRSPHTCPHGRPTLIHISGDQLAREFGRT